MAAAGAVLQFCDLDALVFSRPDQKHLDHQRCVLAWLFGPWAALPAHAAATMSGDEEVMHHMPSGDHTGSQISRASEVYRDKCGFLLKRSGGKTSSMSPKGVTKAFSFGQLTCASSLAPTPLRRSARAGARAAGYAHPRPGTSADREGSAVLCVFVCWPG